MMRTPGAALSLLVAGCVSLMPTISVATCAGGARFDSETGAACDDLPDGEATPLIINEDGSVIIRVAEGNHFAYTIGGNEPVLIDELPEELKT
jgi:hypothetical protein